MLIGSNGERYDLTLTQGDTFLASGVVTLPNGTPFNLTGSTLYAEIKRNTKTTVISAVLTIGIVDASNGKYSLTISRGATAALECGENKSDPKSRYAWGLKLTEPDGRQSTLAKGEVFVERKSVI